MNAPVLDGPCIPHPTTPMVIRSDGAGFPSAPSALAGMMVGAATASPAAARKRRRLIPGLKEEQENCFMHVRTPDPGPKFEEKMIYPSDLSDRSDGSDLSNSFKEARGSAAAEERKNTRKSKIVNPYRASSDRV